MNKVNYPLLVLCTVFVLIISTTSVFSQKFEPGIFAGGSNYFGDLNPNTNLSAVQPAGGVFLRYYFDARFALRLNGGAGWVSFEDAKSSDPQQQIRNLSFKSHIYEVSLLSEFYFFEIVERSRKKNFSPYGFVGFGLFNFKPKANFNGEWIELQPLGTEGQNISSTAGYDRSPYNLLEFMIPYGGGIKYKIDESWSVGFEFGNRWTFTDYLDDVSTTYVDERLLRLSSGGGLAVALSDRSGEISPEPIGRDLKQRGDDIRNDKYLFSVVTLTFKIKGSNCPKAN